MAAAKNCSRLQDSLLNEGQSNIEHAHILSCPDCKSLEETIGRLRLARGGFYPAPPVKLARSIIDAAFPKPTSVPWGLVALTLCAAIGIMVFSFIALSSLSSSPADAPEIRTPVRMPSAPASPPIAAVPNLHPDTRRIIMADGERLVAGPDGTQYELSGRVDLRILDRGFVLQEGVITAHVKPGKGLFTGKTPHGNIEVLGTVFKVMVKIDRTYVSVHEGKVRVSPARAPQRILTAAQTIEMSATPETNGSSTWACPPGQETIQR